MFGVIIAHLEALPLPKIKDALEDIPQNESYDVYLVGTSKNTKKKSTPERESKSDINKEGACAFNFEQTYEEDRFPRFINVAVLSDTSNANKCWNITHTFTVLKLKQDPKCKESRKKLCVVYTEEKQIKVVGFKKV